MPHVKFKSLLGAEQPRDQFYPEPFPVVLEQVRQTMLQTAQAGQIIFNREFKIVETKNPDGSIQFVIQWSNGTESNQVTVCP